MSDIESGTATSGATGKKRQAKRAIGEAGDTLKSEAKSFAGVAQDRVRVEAQKGARAGARTLGDFANAVRRAGDELAQADQSPASRLVQRAADGLESLSRDLADRDPGDLLNDVRDFGRRHPAAFIGGAVLVGLALGRVARAADASGRDGADRRAAGDLGIDQPVAAGLGDLATTNAAATAAPLGADDGSAGMVQPDPTSPHTGGR
ncbi:MAG: hypothetical protein ACOY5Y_17265 [Pseudomonadota bacterium]